MYVFRTVSKICEVYLRVLFALLIILLFLVADGDQPVLEGQST